MKYSSYLYFVIGLNETLKQHNMKKGIIDYFSVQMYHKDKGCSFTVKVPGTDANNKTEARKEALRMERGKIENITVIYLKKD